MTDSFENEQGFGPEAPQETKNPALGVPVKVLRWLELRGLALDHGTLRKQAAGDVWWVEFGGEIQGPVAFGEIITLLANGWGPVSVVRGAESQQENPPWRKLTYKPLWRRPWFACLWSVAFWGICAALGFCVLQSYLPYATKFRFFSDIGYWVVMAALGVRSIMQAVKPKP